jgi:hypothetical protein
MDLGFTPDFEGAIDSEWRFDNCCLHNALKIISIFGRVQMKVPEIKIRNSSDLKEACINFSVETYSNLGLVKMINKNHGFEHFAVRYEREFISKINGIDYYPNFVIDTNEIYLPEYYGFKIERRN